MARRSSDQCAKNATYDPSLACPAQVVFPDAQHAPAFCAQQSVHLSVACFVRFQFRAPEFRITSGLALATDSLRSLSCYPHPEPAAIEATLPRAFDSCPC